MAPSAGFAPFRKTRFQTGGGLCQLPGRRSAWALRARLALSGLGWAPASTGQRHPRPRLSQKVPFPFPQFGLLNRHPPSPATFGCVCESSDEKKNELVRETREDSLAERPEERREGDMAKGCVQVAAAEALLNSPGGPKRLGSGVTQGRETGPG